MAITAMTPKPFVSADMGDEHTRYIMYGQKQMVEIMVNNQMIVINMGVRNSEKPTSGIADVDVVANIDSVVDTERCLKFNPGICAATIVSPVSVSSGVSDVMVPRSANV